MRAIVLITLIIISISFNALAQKSTKQKGNPKKFDSIAPVLYLPTDITLEANRSTGRIVNFNVRASDNKDRSPSIICSPVSNSLFPVGRTAVTCETSDKKGNTTSDSFLISIVDTTAPILSLPSDINVSASADSGGQVSFTSTATDIVDGNVAAICAPASGTFFSVGHTNVICNARDRQGNTAEGSFSINVRDNTSPILDIPAYLTQEATSANGASVSYSAIASDLSDGTIDILCSPASGSNFKLGITTVNCQASDSDGNTTSDSFEITIIDTTSPLLTLPNDLVNEASSSLGASVSFNAQASDKVDGASSVSCNPASGTTFPLGESSIKCTAWDKQGNTTIGLFNVTVIDSIAPQLQLPTDMTIETTSTSGTAVTYSVTASDIVDGNVPIVCFPVSGSVFTVGVSPVACEASDSHANTAADGFLVMVLETSDDGAPPPTSSSSVLLTWSIPTSRENGNALAINELVAYEIYVISDNAVTNDVITIDDPYATTYTLENLAPGTYHFSMSAIDTGGEKSELSDVVTALVE
ncbi:MAG: HYR domain-containing protein [Spongiibacteraceae bacterium]|nr:HYR domain-containing protein [Spongiibacteraceae bacterium]